MQRYILVSVVALLLSASPARAAWGPAPTAPAPMGFTNPKPTVDTGALNVMKTEYGKAVRGVLRRIDQAQSSLASMTVPGGARCSSSAALQQFEDALRAQLLKVDAMTSVTEVMKIQAETIGLLTTNRDTLAAGIIAYVDCVYSATVAAEKAYLASAKVEALSMKVAGSDVTKLLEDIGAANALLAQSETQHLVAATPQTKTAAYQTLAKTSPYILSISKALGAEPS